MRYFLVFVTLLSIVSCSSKMSVPTSCNDIKSCSLLVRAKLISNLDIDDAFVGHTVKIEFFLNDNAEVVEYKVTNGSDFPAFKEATIVAINKSSPFSAIKALPKDAFEEFKHIVLTVSPTSD